MDLKPDHPEASRESTLIGTSPPLWRRLIRVRLVTLISLVAGLSLVLLLLTPWMRSLVPRVPSKDEERAVQVALAGYASMYGPLPSPPNVVNVNAYYIGDREWIVKITVSVDPILGTLRNIDTFKVRAECSEWIGLMHRGGY